MSRRRPSIDWRELTWLVESSLKGVSGFSDKPRVDGKLSYIPEGIGHDNYIFAVGDESYVLRMPKRFDPVHSPERALELLNREMKTLQQLERLSLPFRIPRLICPVTDEKGATVGFIETGVRGYPLRHMESGGRDRTRLTMIGEAAAQIHRVPTPEFEHLPPCLDSESHVRASLAEIPAPIFDRPGVAAARDWILAHVINRPAVLLHGDLLPQNLLCDIKDNDTTCVLDWEYAQLGDPAFDLAIVTRGTRRPQQESGGFQNLLSSYSAASGNPMPASAVRIHEMLMIMKWLASSAEARARGDGRGEGPDAYASQLGAVLRRSQTDT